MPDPPETAEGWYVLHDLRTIDWDAWHDAPQGARDRAIESGEAYLSDAVAVEDAAEGDSASFVVLGHEADLMFVHLRPTLAELDALERRFEHTEFARFTDRTASYVSVTEASGYTGAEDYFDPEAEADQGMRNYIESRLYPELPAVEFVSFYPMDKRRDPEYNWYDLEFDERAAYMSAHGDIGRQYAGTVSQIISGSIGLDDFEWGVTLFAEDPIDVKDLLYEMRFDPSSSRFAEFGPFYSGRRFPPSDLEAVLAGEPVPTQPLGDADAAPGLDADLANLGVPRPDAGHAVLVRSTAAVDALEAEVDGLRGNFEHYDTHLGTTVHDADDGAAVVSVWETASAADTASGFLESLEGVTDVTVGPVGDADPSEGAATDDESAGGKPPHVGGDDERSDHDAADQGHDQAEPQNDADDDSIREELAERGIYGGQPHGEDVYALVLYSGADLEHLAAEVEDLSEGFDRYDTHVKTAVYEADGADHAVVSIWETEDAAGTASEYLSDLPEITRQAGEGEGFGTMGMFYTVEPDSRDAFVEKFDTVEELLEDMAGHRDTVLYANREAPEDMFIASQWDAKEDCMAFFRSDAFQDTVDWGRDVLADRPRHVFLA